GAPRRARGRGARAPRGGPSRRKRALARPGLGARALDPRARRPARGEPRGGLRALGGGPAPRRRARAGAPRGAAPTRSSAGGGLLDSLRGGGSQVSASGATLAAPALPWGRTFLHPLFDYGLIGGGVSLLFAAFVALRPAAIAGVDTATLALVLLA